MAARQPLLGPTHWQMQASQICVCTILGMVSKLLSECHPELEVQYSSINPVPFTEIRRSHPGAVQWECPKGHWWSERVPNRLSVHPKWKEGVWGACPHCAGVLLKHACGHDQRHQINSPGDPSVACFTCVSAAKEKRWEEILSRKAEIDARAKELDALVTPLAGPKALTQLAQSKRTHALKTAASYEIIDKDFNARDLVLEQLEKMNPLAPLPSLEECRGKVAVKLSSVNKMAWAPGMVKHLGGSPSESAGDALWAKNLKDHLMKSVSPEKASTVGLTCAIEEWARSQDAGESLGAWRTFRELTIPWAPDDETIWGRVDLVVSPVSGLDLVIEIDQTNKEISLKKLEFAWHAGGVPVWVRWGKGAITLPPWLTVIDLRVGAPSKD